MANRIDRIFILDGLNRAKTIFIVFVLMQVLGATSPAAKAQADTDPLETIGVRPVPDFLPIPNGHVDLSSGDLHIDIPLGTFSQRGRSQVTTSLLYDSAIWSQGAAQWTTSEYYGPLIGWQFATPAPADLISNKSSNGEYCTASKSYDWINLTDYSWTGPDGTVRSFPLAAEQLGLINKCGTYASSYKGGYAGDASGYYLNLASTGMTVYSPDGTIKFSNDPTIDPSGGAIDANGNYLTAASPAVVDTLERNPVTETTNGNTITYGVLNSKREYSNYIVTTEVINVWTDFDASGSSIPDSQGTLTVIESIELPDGTSYSFGYDSGTTRGHYGQLTSMTLPTGGQITYTYENFADSECCFGHITRGINTMTTPDGKWTLTPAVIVQCSATVSVCEQSMTVAEPSGDTSVHTFDVSEGTWPIQVQYYTGPVASANLLMTQTQTFNNLGGVDVTKASETVTLPIPGGTSLNRTTQYVWDTSNYGNLMKKMEWNFYTGSLPASADRTTSYSYQTASNYISKNILKLVTNVTVTDKKSNTVAQTANSFDGASSLTSVTGIAHHDDTNYGTGNTTRGNLTQVQRLISGTSNYLTTSQTYDTTGQTLTSTDSNNNQTMYNYADNLFTDAGDGQNPVPFTPPAPTNAYLKTVTQGSLVTTFGYYWGKGQNALVTDPNLQTTYHHFYDSLDRSTSTTFPDAGWTFSVYPSGSETEIDTGTGITSPTLTTNCPTSCRHDEVLLDGLGRVTSKILVSDPLGQDKVVTAYDSDGRVSTATNPYRTTSDSTYGTYETGYDGLNRLVLLGTQTGAAATSYGAKLAGGLSSQLCSTSYGFGYPILNQDEDGNLLQSWIDGFGRLIEVDEPNSTGTLSVSTCYSYDLNNNLIGVAQGTEARSFSYDMLSRLTSATNPESGAINYYYTTSGGSLCSGDPSAVCRRKDAKLVTTTYAYDNLNRLLSKMYSDSTPTVSYSYDQATCIGTSPCYNKGHRTGMTDAATIAAGSEIWSYDKLGRIWGDQRKTNSVTEQTTYAYNLDGSLATLYYPSQTSMSYVYNSAQQPTAVSSLNTGFVYGTNGTYTPNGDLLTLSNSTEFNSTFIYNPRLQPCWIYVTAAPNSLPATSTCNNTATAGSILDLKFNFALGLHGTHDNGNVIGITNNRDTTRSQAFTYDPLNRVSTAQTTSTYTTSPANCWGESYQYDQWGNLLSIGVSSSAYTGCTQQTLSIGVNGSNQISSPTGYVYDADGNLTIVPAPGAASYTYNAENEMTSTATAGVNYIYDGIGQRVEKSNGKLYWYSNSGQVLDETDLNGNLTSEYVFFGGQRIARRDSPSNNIFYYFGDHLGTSREIVESAQTSPCYDADFYPFGGERTPIVNTCTQNYKFTGKERDGESGLDNFDRRYMGSSVGRFMSPDPDSAGARLENPQSWNAYSYVLNNPLKYTDPFGLDCIYLNEAGNAVDHIDPGNCGSDDDPGYFVDNDPNHPVQKSDVTFSQDGSVGLISYTNANGVTTSYKCVGDCPPDSVQVTAKNPDTPTMSAAPVPGTQQLQNPPRTFWEWVTIVAGCSAGLDPELMGPMNIGSGAPSSRSGDSTKEAEGQKRAQVMGSDGRPLKYRNGKPVNLNPQGSENAEAAAAAAGGVAVAANAARCVGNASQQ